MSKRNPPGDEQKKPNQRFPDSDTSDHDDVRYERMPKENPKKDKNEEAKKDKKSEKEKKEDVVVTNKKSSLDRVKTQELLPGRRDSLSLAQLSRDEEQFFEIVESGNVREVEKFLKEHCNLNANCIDYCGLSALHAAVKKKDIDIVKLLLGYPGLHIKDCALHAVATEDVGFATAVLDILKNISPELEKAGFHDSLHYSPDITPLAIAAQNGDFRMVRMLIERGHAIDKPHAPDCLCPTCKALLCHSDLSMSQIRLNAYKAVSNPAYICQVTDDPILYCFEIDREMEACSNMDQPFKAEYEKMIRKVRKFTVELLSQCRDTSETEMLLELPWGFDEGGPKIKYPRVQLALDFKQREFVAHSLVQHVLTAHWLGEFRSWPRLSVASKILHCFVRFLMLPFLCLALVVMPWYHPLKKYHSPLNRFLLHLVSYLIFLLLVFLLNHLDTGKFHKGPPKTGVEGIIIIYVVGFIWATIRQLWVEGKKRFFRALWNWYDMIMELLFVMTFILWHISYQEVLHDRQHNRLVLERKFWRGDDSTLLHIALFSWGSVLAFGRLAYFCQLSSRLGPFQDNADVEFKFARAKLWNRFFDDSTLLPPPFNLFPTGNFFTKCSTYFRALARNVKGGTAKFSLGRCCYVKYEEEKHMDYNDYQEFLINLVQRYLTVRSSRKFSSRNKMMNK